MSRGPAPAPAPAGRRLPARFDRAAVLLGRLADSRRDLRLSRRLWSAARNCHDLVRSTDR